MNEKRSNEQKKKAVGAPQGMIPGCAARKEIKEIDDAGRDSFPASDPPGWTLGRDKAAENLCPHDVAAKKDRNRKRRS